MKQVKRFLLAGMVFLLLQSVFAQQTSVDAFLARTDAAVSAVAWSPDGKYFATSWGSSVILWDADTNTVSAVWAGHKAPVIGTKFSADGQWLLSVSQDNSVIIRNVDEKVSAVKVTGEGKYPIKDATFMDNGYSVMIPVDGLTTTHCFRLMMTNQFVFKDVTSSLLPVISLDVSHDFTKLLITADDGTVQLYSLEEGRELASYPRYAESGIGAKFSPDGTHFLAAADKNSLVISPVQGSGSFVIRDADMPVHTAVYSPDGKTVAVALANGMVRIYKTADGSLADAYSILPDADDVVESLAYSPEGDALLAGSKHGYIFRWWLSDSARGRMIPIQKSYEDKELRKLADMLKDNTVLHNARTDEEEIAYEVTKNASKKIVTLPENFVDISVFYNTLASDYYWGAVGLTGAYRTYQFYPLYVGAGGALSAGGPNDNYPYTLIMDEKQLGNPWLYSAGVHGIAGLCYFKPELELLVFSELHLGVNLRLLMFNDFTYYQVGTPHVGMNVDILAGAQWKQFRVSLGGQYDTNLGMLFKVTAGIVFPVGTKKKETAEVLSF